MDGVEGKIACLGWGSLIWRNEELACDRVWRVDGPELAVEFARKSRSGEVTLVIVDDGPSVPVRWSVMNVSRLGDAIESLRVRERTVRKWIGAWSPDTKPTGQLQAQIEAWALPKGLIGVVWTALPAKWDDVERVPQLAEVLAYLSSLAPDARALAKRYILDAPPQIATPYRPALAAWAEKEG